MKQIGKRDWLIPGGHMPVNSTGREPDFTSHDLIAVLNTSQKTANVELMVHYTDSEPIGPYVFTVAAQRVRRVRINDLIDPQAVPLDVAYALSIRASVPVVIQFTRQDTTHANSSTMGTLGYPLD